MKLSVKENRGILLEEVFNGVEFKTADQESLTVLMRDSGFEVTYEGNIYNLQKGKTKLIGKTKVKQLQDRFAELGKIAGEQYKQIFEDELDKLVRYCRVLQKEFIEGDGKQSGTSFLGELLQQGNLKPNVFVQILPAIEDYKSDYELQMS